MNITKRNFSKLSSIKIKGLNFTKLFLIVLLVSCGEKKPYNAPKLKNITIFESDSLYTAWPSIARTPNGNILVVFTETEEHMAPDGKIVGVISKDEGRTWLKPFLVYNSPIDDRESGITQLNNGSLIIHLWSTLETPGVYHKMPQGSYFPNVIKRWIKQVSRPNYVEADSLAGGHVAISHDGGSTWSKVAKGPDSIHGGIQLKNGTILVASYRGLKNAVSVNIAQKWDGPWRKIAEIHSLQPDSIRFGEPSVLQLPTGRIIMMIRATTIPYNDADPRCFLWETYSDDNGKTWVKPYQTPLWGFPTQLLLLKDGRVVVTYGYRRPPFGIRAAVSKDGITWKKENEVILRDDAPNKDLGYPASIELKDGRILTVYYFPAASDTVRPKEGPLPGRHKPDILGTIWTAPKIQ